MTHEELIAEINKELEITHWEAWHEGARALLAVVELHSPKMYEGRVSNYLICTGCYEEEGPNYDYPCPTIQAIEAELG